MFSTLRKFSAQPGIQIYSPNSRRKSHSKLVRVFDVCLEMPSDSKNYFGFVVDEFSEFVHTVKPLVSLHLEDL